MYVKVEFVRLMISCNKDNERYNIRCGNFPEKDPTGYGPSRKARPVSKVLSEDLSSS